MNPMQILLIGPGAGSGIGGYQSANRRTVNGLQARGMKVLGLSHRAPTRMGKLYGYLRGVAGTLAGVLSTLRSGCGTVVHVTALYRHFVYYEFFLLLLARAVGARYIYDVRAGSAKRVYDTAGLLYRLVFRAMLRKADEVFIEGEDYAGFVAGIRGRPAVYVPNYVERASGEAGQHAEPLQLVYVGRVVREKGVALALETCQWLRDAGVACELSVLGDGPEEFVSELRDMIASYRAQRYISLLGGVSAARVEQALEKAHFFIFPTEHAGEGHSNSLTEAMAKGAVPVCSDHGFNASVVGNAGRVLPRGASAADYGKAILEVWNPGGWEALSARARRRVDEAFTSEVVIPKLIRSYHSVLGVCP